MKKVLLATALLAVGYGGWRLVGGGGGDQAAETSVDDSKLALDRIWIDHLPRSEKDMIQVFAAVSEEEFGVFQHTSAWKGAFELFRFNFKGGDIHATYPQDNSREKITVKATRCNEGQMDYCLEVSGSSRGVKKYYSRKGWEIDSAQSAKDLEAQTDALAKQLSAGLPADEE
ncbi:MAG: hypothetical protein JNL83_19730 [Myxococcales bacterium]|nr:hypothetical protein [Myxococcales bacterium]